MALSNGHQLNALLASFHRLQNSFNRYETLLKEAAPLYDDEKSPGPPFDSFYHVEVLDRARKNMSKLLEESDDHWQMLESGAEVSVTT